MKYSHATTPYTWIGDRALLIELVWGCGYGQGPRAAASAVAGRAGRI